MSVFLTKCKVRISTCYSIIRKLKTTYLSRNSKFFFTTCDKVSSRNFFCTQQRTNEGMFSKLISLYLYNEMYIWQFENKVKQSKCLHVMSKTVTCHKDLYCLVSLVSKEEFLRNIELHPALRTPWISKVKIYCFHTDTDFLLGFLLTFIRTRRSSYGKFCNIKIYCCSRLKNNWISYCSGN